MSNLKIYHMSAAGSLLNISSSLKKDLTPPSFSPLSYRKLEECRHPLSDNWDKDHAACRLSPGQPAACSCCLLLLQPHHSSWQAAVPSEKPWCHPNCRFLLSNAVTSICYERRTDKWVINAVILLSCWLPEPPVCAPVSVRVCLNPFVVSYSRHQIQ